MFTKYPERVLEAYQTWKHCYSSYVCLMSSSTISFLPLLQIWRSLLMLNCETGVLLTRRTRFCTALWLNYWPWVACRVRQLLSVQDSFPGKNTTISWARVHRPAKVTWVGGWQQALQPCFQWRLILSARRRKHGESGLNKQTKKALFFSWL